MELGTICGMSLKKNLLYLSIVTLGACINFPENYLCSFCHLVPSKNRKSPTLKIQIVYEESLQEEKTLHMELGTMCGMSSKKSLF